MNPAVLLVLTVCAFAVTPDYAFRLRNYDMANHVQVRFRGDANNRIQYQNSRDVQKSPLKRMFPSFRKIYSGSESETPWGKRGEVVLDMDVLADFDKRPQAENARTVYCTAFEAPVCRLLRLHSSG
ncbi:uncharacterized protein LOC106154297 [Lingula anatina]|uniref:Uncharacterized protein LOC106154297 n=1 Tax=Lingula anatina TaxID=7574 RepID=A0A1S3HDE8_LINAN|nr:uncharacterized protein LOC106154297 [Lingula anatina]|eukprot:XP_013384067.1 uncharacterized protein LOC106154297 [Lingula anatina]